MSKTLTTLILFIELSFNMLTFSQESLNAAGGNVLGTSGSVSYSIGQTFYTSFKTGTGTLQHGVQLPYEIEIISSNQTLTSFNLDCSIFPNPAVDFITLKINNIQLENFTLELTTAHGITIQKQKITQNDTPLNLQTLTRGVYFIKVRVTNNEIKTFKIIKH